PEQVNSRKLVAKKPGGPQRNRRVEDAEDQSRSDQTQPWNQQQREQQRGAQSAKVIEGEDVRDQLAELKPVLENAHEQRNFQAHQNTYRDYHQVEDEPEGLGIGERQEQHRRGESSHQSNHQLDADEARDQAAIEKAREPAPDPHGEEIAADDGR